MRANRLFTWRLFLLLALYSLGFQFVIDLSDWLQGTKSDFSISSVVLPFFVNYPNLLLLFYLNTHLIGWLDKRYPWEQTETIIIRVLLELFCSVLIVAFQVVTVNILIALVAGEDLNFKAYLFSAIIGGVINLILIPTMEFSLQYNKRFEAAIDNEWLKKENLRYQYEVLKNQLNPHFLFNSLSSLSSLVSSDSQRAKEFIRKLSQVYRHVLEHGNEGLISVEQELRFINGYIYLLKTRFDDSLVINIAISSNFYDKKIVPMALQVAIENAVKHNSTSEGNPLIIDIGIEGESLTISNPLRPKRNSNSSGIGLKNLQNTYRHHHNEIRIDAGNSYFKVSLPLI